MKKIILLLVFLLGITVSADSLPAEEEDFMPTDIKTVIQPSYVKVVTTYYPDASEDEDSVVTSIVTVFKGSPSTFTGFDIDTDEEILY